VKESNDFLAFKIYYQLGKNSRRAKTFSSWEETKFFLSGNFCTFETICYPNCYPKIFISYEGVVHQRFCERCDGLIWAVATIVGG